MSKINEQHLLDEIRYDIKQKDIIKARLVLAELDSVGAETQKKALFEVSRADDDFSIPLLAGVIANNMAILETFPQVKETMISKILDNPDVLMGLLTGGEELKARVILIETAGEIQLSKSAPILLDILKGEKDPEIIRSVIESLGMIGDPSAVEPVSEFLYSGTRDVVISAVSALGQIGNAASVNKLYDRLGGETDLDLLILNTISGLQINEAYERLNDILSSEFVHLRTAAKKKLVEIGSMSIRFMIKNLLLKDPDIVIHSLNVIADLGDSSAIAPIRKLLFNEPEDPNVRFAAYEALGRLPLEKGAFTLASGLEDPVDNVKSAAARAIERNYNPVLSGGIKNMIKSGNVNALKIITTIIDSQCENIFLDLIDDDAFKNPAMQYLIKKAHPDVKAVFAKLLAEAGYDDLAARLAPDIEKKGKGKLKVFAVDDSRMILNIYRTILHNLGCDSLLFEFPASALESVQKEKPDIILTDLNMPDITGIDLTREIRKKYTKEKLPVVMVTTQDESRDYKTALEAGINDIMRKPFTETQVGEMLEKITGHKIPS
ncbi:MAG: response regulator [Deltaproteobacteria bacterium]|nr:response regulator [Deltaproteobacteria bacterium]